MATVAGADKVVAAGAVWGWHGWCCLGLAWLVLHGIGMAGAVVLHGVGMAAVVWSLAGAMLYEGWNALNGGWLVVYEG